MVSAGLAAAAPGPAGAQDRDAGAGAPVPDEARLVEMRRSYVVMEDGFQQGSVEYTLRREPDVGEDPLWESVAVMSSAMAGQEQSVRFTVGDLVPVSYAHRATHGDPTVAAELVVEEGRVTGSARLPDPDGGVRERRFDTPLPNDAVLPGMDEFVLAASDLSAGTRVSVPVLDIVEGGITTVTFRVEGEETVDVPAGSFESYRVRAEAEAGPATLYVRKEAPHVLVKQEYPGRPVTLELVRLDEEPN